MGKWLEIAERWMGGGAGGNKRANTLKWLAIIGLIGVAMLVLNSFVTVKEVDPLQEGKASPQEEQQVFLDKNKQDLKFDDYEQTYESSIKDILEKIVGVGEVDVLVTIESTEEIVVERNRRDSQQVTNEKDQNGSNRHIAETTRDGEVVLYEVSGNQTPIVLKQIKPKIRGVIIVAKGAENLTVKKLISEAVGRGLGVPPHRISIVPHKQN